MTRAPIQYMTADGTFVGSYDPDTPCEVPGAVLAPPGGMSGMRWTGSAWVEDTLTAWRKGCAVARWQIIAALDLTDPALWPVIEAYAASEDCDPVTKSAIRNVDMIPRVSQMVDFFAWLLDMTPPQVDDLFRLAETIRG